MRCNHFGFNTHGNVIPVPCPNERNVTLIAAMDSQRGIGKHNQMPWAVSPDMQQFRRLTTGHNVIMGRKTWESLGCKALPKRTNVLLGRDVNALNATISPKDVSSTFATDSLANAIDIIGDEQIFIIGGGQIYKEVMAQNCVDDMILTRFNHNALCDTFFPEIDLDVYQRVAHSTHALSGGVSMRYEYWKRRSNT